MTACIYPKIALVAWQDRIPTGFIFVPDPLQRGRYIRTDKCVAKVPCGHCEAIPGEPCKGRHGYHAHTHHVRRSAYTRLFGRGHPENDVHDEYIDIVFDSLPGPDGCRFIEAENPRGCSITAGEWVERPDGLCALRIPTPAPPVPFERKFR